MKDNSGKIILALLAGASAGIVAGLLMAPDSGSVSRDNLKKYAGKLSKDLERTVQDNLGKLGNINTSAVLQSLGLSKLAGGGEGETANGGAAPGSAAGGTTGSAAGRTGTDASAGNPPRGRAAGGSNPTGAGPEVGEEG
jgi:YtxH-like protein